MQPVFGCVKLFLDRLYFIGQVLEIYATSVDYDAEAEISNDFFKKVQNKIHYAIHGETAAETIYHRVDAKKLHGEIDIQR